MPDGPDDSPEAMAKFTEDFQAELDKVELPSEMSNPLRSESVVSLIDDICAGRRNVHILNTANEGAIPNLPRHALVEVETVTDSTGARVVHMDEAPVVLKGMLEKRFAWQELVADAAVTGDRNLAMQALMLDEMAIFPDKAEPMLDELLEASRALLPQFFT
jgi:6-phospho-beta-glucosidase